MHYVIVTTLCDTAKSLRWNYLSILCYLCRSVRNYLGWCDEVFNWHAYLYAVIIVDGVLEYVADVDKMMFSSSCISCAVCTMMLLCHWYCAWPTVLQGKWTARKIPNPNYFEDLEPYKMTPIVSQLPEFIVSVTCCICIEEKIHL